MQFQRVQASERPILLCEWMHCLADALASLHHRGTAHTAIRPSNTLIDHENRIAFADLGSLRTFQKDKKINKNEIYDYAAPESQLSQAPLSLASSPPVSSIGAFNKLRKMSSSTSGSSSGSSHGGSTRSNSLCTVATTPTTPPSTGRSDSMATISTTLSPSKGSGPFRNFSRHLRGSPSTCGSNVSNSSATVIRILPKPTIPDPDLLQDLPEASPEMSDIYSLGCVFLNIITFLMKGKINDFVKFRTTRVGTGFSNHNKLRNDSSFHLNSEKVDAWIDTLRDDSERLNEQIHRGVPAILELIRRMLTQNATLRPSAIEIRDRIQEILVGECSVEALCCANREWDVLPVPESAAAASKSWFRDSVSEMTTLSTARPRTASGCPISPSRSEHQASSLSRTESNTLSTRSRRTSSGSAATAKVSSWRRAFSRSS